MGRYSRPRREHARGPLLMVGRGRPKIPTRWDVIRPSGRAKIPTKKAKIGQNPGSSHAHHPDKEAEFCSQTGLTPVKRAKLPFRARFWASLALPSAKSRHFWRFWRGVRSENPDKTAQNRPDKMFEIRAIFGRPPKPINRGPLSPQRPRSKCICGMFCDGSGTVGNTPAPMSK